MRSAFLLVGQSNGPIIAPHLFALLCGYYGPDTLLIDACVPGSSIAEWQPGQPYYQNAVTLAKQAIADGFTLRALGVVHGEHDAQFSTAFTYGASVLNVIDGSTVGGVKMNGLRADVGLPYLLTIIRMLGTKPEPMAEVAPYVNWSTIWVQQYALGLHRPTIKIVQTATISKYDTVNKPGCHLTDASAALVANEMFIPIKAYSPLPVAEHSK